MKKVYKSTLVVLASLFLLGSCTPQANNKAGAMKSPIEYVNPYICWCRRIRPCIFRTA